MNKLNDIKCPWCGSTLDELPLSPISVEKVCWKCEYIHSIDDGVEE